MKKLIAIMVVLFFAGTSFAQITSTAHNLAGAAWNTGTDEICITCHTPHNDDVTVTTPLWNHALTTQTFQIYASATMDATTGQPNGESKLCLSCHDGVTAVDNYGATTDGTVKITGAPMIGTDLRNDHPVSFTYNTDLETADGGLKSSVADGPVDDLLIGGQVECASCHNAHSNANGKFLVMSNAASALCLTCHNK